MAKSGGKFGIVVALVVLGMLFLFGYYTYNGTVIHYSRSEGNPTYVIVPQLKIENLSSSGTRIVTAQLSLFNSGNARVRLLDTVALEPLYEVKLRLQPADGGPSVNVPTRSQNWVRQRAGYDPEIDGISELIPGSALTRSIPLAALYDLQRDGRYELTLTYQPEAITKISGADSALAGVHSQKLICSMGFELLPKKVQPAPGDAKAPPAGNKPPAQVEKASQ